MPDLSALRDLLSVPPARFTAERDERSRALKAAGDKAAAAELKAVKKPSSAVWLLNALARAHAEAVEGFLVAMASVRAAQGRDAQALKDAMRTHRDAMAALVALSEGLAESAALPAASSEKVRDALHQVAEAPEAWVAAWKGAVLLDGPDSWESGSEVVKEVVKEVVTVVVPPTPALPVVEEPSEAGVVEAQRAKDAADAEAARVAREAQRKREAAEAARLAARALAAEARLQADALQARVREAEAALLELRAVFQRAEDEAKRLEQEAALRGSDLGE